MSFKTLRNSFRFFSLKLFSYQWLLIEKMQIEVIYKVKKTAAERTVHTENTEDI